MFSNPDSPEIEGNRRIVLTFMKMSDSNLEILKQFSDMFNTETLNHSIKWDNRITHFVIYTQSDNLINYRSFKFLHALYSGCFIVNFYWIQHCLKSGTLLPEVPYIIHNCIIFTFVWQLRYNCNLHFKFLQLFYPRVIGKNLQFCDFSLNLIMLAKF